MTCCFPQVRLNALDEQWQFLVNKSAEKSQKLKEANKQQNFNTGIKDFDFWLSEVRVSRPDKPVNTHRCTEKTVSEVVVSHCGLSSGGSPSCLWGLWQRSGLSQQPAEETPAAGSWYFCPWGNGLHWAFSAPLLFSHCYKNVIECGSVVPQGNRRDLNLGHLSILASCPTVTNCRIPSWVIGSQKKVIRPSWCPQKEEVNCSTQYQLSPRFKVKLRKYVHPDVEFTASLLVFPPCRTVWRIWTVRLTAWWPAMPLTPRRWKTSEMPSTAASPRSRAWLQAVAPSSTSRTACTSSLGTWMMRSLGSSKRH